MTTGRAPVVTLSGMDLHLLTSPAVYPLLFGLTLLDGFIPVVPSESAVIAAGAFTVTGRPVLLAVVLAAAVGAFVGDHVAYGLGRLLLGRAGPLNGPGAGAAGSGAAGSGAAGAGAAGAGAAGAGRGGRVRGWAQRLADGAAAHLGRRAGVLVLTGRFVPCGRLAVTLGCGAARYPLRRFTAWTALATAAWAAYTALLGYVGGVAFADTPWLGVVAGMVLGLIVSAVLAVVSRRRPRPSGRGRGRHQLAGGA